MKEYEWLNQRELSALYRSFIEVCLYTCADCGFTSTRGTRRVAYSERGDPRVTPIMDIATRYVCSPCYDEWEMIITAYDESKVHRDRLLELTKKAKKELNRVRNQANNIR